MPRILFVAAHRPDRSPSQRYRFEQFASYWAEKGFTHEYAWLIGAEDDEAFYSPGRLAAKAGIFLRNVFDTMIAAKFLGRTEVGLQATLRDELGVTISKGNQKDDWSARPG